MNLATTTTFTAIRIPKTTKNGPIFTNATLKTISNIATNNSKTKDGFLNCINLS